MLGGHLVERLLAEHVEVRAFVRPGSDTAHLDVGRVDVLVGDLTDESDVARAVAGVDLVFHVAGYLTVGAAFGDSPGGFERYRSANVDPTETLVRASARAAVARFVYTSSVSVYDLEAPVPIGEDAALQPASDYGRSKLLAEQRVQAFGEELETTIVRPCIAYGTRDRYFVPAVLRLARLPVLPLVDGGRHLIDLVHADDVAELMWRAAGSAAAAGRIYNAASGSPLALRALIEEIAAVIDRRLRICSVPPQLLRRTSSLARRYVRIFSPGVETLLSPMGRALMARDVYFDVSRARHELGYAARVDLRDGLASALAPRPVSGSVPHA